LKSSKLSHVQVGEPENGNYTNISETGEMRSYGTATMWDDITVSLIAQNLESNTGTVDYNFAENTIIMQRNGNITNASDRLIFNFQKPHAAKPNSEMRLHIHWEQPSAVNFVWTIQYRIQNNNAPKTTAWQTVTAQSNTDSVYTYPGTGVFNQITRLVAVDLSAVGISSTVQFRVCRTDANAVDINATFIDAHIEYDSNGSETDYGKV